MRPLLLDLFCGAGGAAMGYHRAGFDVVGVDIAPQPRYPFTFMQWDALDAGLLDNFRPVAIHASPPCQRYSDLSKGNGNADMHPDLVEPTRMMLIASGLSYVIENVEGAPLLDPVRYCGTSFPPLRVIRHRLFESNAELVAPPCDEHPLLYRPDYRRPHQMALDPDASFVSVTGGGNCTVANARRAMGIDWMTKAELNEAVPPAYTEHIGRQLLAHVRRAAA